MKCSDLEYVLITPAHNEGLFIENVLRSMLSQTISPRVWVIVNDNSSDNTSDIVEQYSGSINWIVLLRARSNSLRPFPSRVYAFDVGLEYITKVGIHYDLIGSLDADISFGADYFQYLLDKFHENPLLGVAGTDYVETGFDSAQDTKASKFHVNGACQLFRKKCFEDIGGYKPIEFFGEDLFAVTMARYQGWETKSFNERVFVHHRPIGTKGAGSLVSKFNQGRHDYILGNTFPWQLLRAVYWTKNRPYLSGGIMLFLGYVWSFMRGDSIMLSPQVLNMYRREQYQRLKELVEKISVKTARPLDNSR